MKLAPGITGGAYFTDDRLYRPYLSRTWRAPLIYVMAIGLNPSTADETTDDPTIRKLIWFATRSHLYSGLMMTNICDYRSTDPRTLLHPDIKPRSDENLDFIFKIAKRATLVVACWGAIDPKLRSYADDVIDVVKKTKQELWCFGKTAGGHPRHPLYLRKQAMLEYEPFDYSKGKPWPID